MVHVSATAVESIPNDTYSIHVIIMMVTSCIFMKLKDFYLFRICTIEYSTYRKTKLLSQLAVNLSLMAMWYQVA